MKTRFPAPQFDDGWTIVPSDTVNFESDVANNPQGYKFGSLYFGGSAAATIVGVTVNGTVLTFKNIQPGTFIPGAFKRINATGTTPFTAGDIIGLVAKMGFQ
jgi:hypothetical protein